MLEPMNERERFNAMTVAKLRRTDPEGADRLAAILERNHQRSLTRRREKARARRTRELAREPEA